MKRIGLLSVILALNCYASAKPDICFLDYTRPNSYSSSVPTYFNQMINLEDITTGPLILIVQYGGFVPGKSKSAIFNLKDSASSMAMLTNGVLTQANISNGSMCDFLSKESLLCAETKCADVFKYVLCFKVSEAMIIINIGALPPCSTRVQGRTSSVYNGLCKFVQSWAHSEPTR